MWSLAPIVVAAGVITAASLAAAVPAKGEHMPAPIVFFDIAGPDMANQSAFYRTVFDWDVAPSGRFSAPITAPLAGTLRADPADKVVYIGVPDIKAALDKVVANGGKVVAARFEIKGVAVLGLFTDPAGNSMGLVELSGAAPKIP